MAFSPVNHRPPRGTRTTATAVALAALALPPLAAQSQAPTAAGSIFVCTDAKGQRFTSDRPIPECADREQREMSASGVIRRVIPGAASPMEQAQAEQRSVQDAEARQREREQQRKDRALLTRYTNQRQHDTERDKQLAQVDATLALLESRTADLKKQEQQLKEEMEFYRADPSKAPPWLQKRIADNTEQQASQKQRVVDQMAERKRVNARFDEELARLRVLWAAQGSGGGATPLPPAGGLR